MGLFWNKFIALLSVCLQILCSLYKSYTTRNIFFKLGSNINLYKVMRNTYADTFFKFVLNVSLKIHRVNPVRISKLRIGKNIYEVPLIHVSTITTYVKGKKVSHRVSFQLFKHLYKIQSSFKENRNVILLS
jgi:hypothetical protein